MSTSDFQFNKDAAVSRFRNYVDQERSREDGYDPQNAKEVEYSKYQVLRKIKELYKFVLENQRLAMRRSLIHDDDAFLTLYNSVKTHIQNKIRTSGQGKVYLHVADYVTFTGDKNQYEEYVLENQSKQSSLMRKIVDELNAVLGGKNFNDKNKPVLVDSIGELVHEQTQDVTKETGEVSIREDLKPIIVDHVNTFVCEEENTDQEVEETTNKEEVEEKLTEE